MNNEYSIRDLEVLSGIKSHTIRIWEQRYALLSPKRTDTNIRYYSDADLRYLLQVALLNSKGLRISKIAKMDTETVNKTYTDHIISDSQAPPQINGLVTAMISMDEVLFSQIFEKNVREYGLKHTIINVIYPFMTRIGTLWITNKIKPIQEHFVLNLIRQKLIAAIERLPLNTLTSKKCLLFMPEKEYHEIGLLLAYYMLKESGYNVYYAGANVPLDNIGVANKMENFSFALLMMTIYPPKNKLQKYVEKVAQTLNETQLFISGYQARFIAHVPKNVKIWRDVTDLVDFIDSSPHSPLQKNGTNPGSSSE